MGALHGIIILSLRIELIERSVLSICDDSSVFCLFICELVSLFHRTTASFGRPSASFDFLYCLNPSHYAYRISLRSVQDTTPEGVLSSCGCHKTSNQSRSSQGYMAWRECHEILTTLCYPQYVSCRDQEKSPGNQDFHVDDERNTQRRQ
jgi:hypothetical protein